MVHLNLNYFNTIQGPQIFHTYPEDADENIVQSVANLLNIGELIKQKFFMYEGGDFKTVSLYIEIPSFWARGKKEMLLLSIILSPDFSIENKDPIRTLLEKIESEINDVRNGFMAFYEYDYSKVEEHEDEIEDLALEMRKIIENYADEAKMALKEARKISLEQIKEIYQQKALGIYVFGDEGLNYFYEIDQDKTPFIRFGDFVDSGISIFTSNECIQELQLDDSIKEIITSLIGNKETSQNDIDALKEGVDPRRLPSDAKLSLIVLIKYLKEMNPDYDLTVVSPNHEYLRFIQDYFPDIKSLPPSSFLLEVINNLESKDSRDYFENFRKRLMNYELQKVMATEKGSGASSENLTWLIEKAIGVASQPIIPISTIEEKEKSGLQLTELSLINKFIAGEPIPEEEFKLIEEYEKFLKGVIDAQDALIEIQEEIAKDELISAQTKIFATTKKLNDLFLLASATLSEKAKRDQIQILLANFIANFEFLAALSHLNLIQLDQSIEQFNLAATFSAVAEQNKKVLISNYLKSITCLYNDAYEDAIHNFAVTSELGEKYSFPGYQIMCLAGRAISELLSGKGGMAVNTMENVSRLIPGNEKDSLGMLIEFGDNFYMKGKPEIAIHLYNEALELAIFLDVQDTATEIYNKLERSFYAVGTYNTPLSVELHNLINKAHILKDDKTIDKYNLQIAKLGSVNKILFETFPFITNDWVPGEELGRDLLEPFDLLHSVVTSRFKRRGATRRKSTFTDLYCYQKKLGGVIIRIPEKLELKIKQIPVIYKISLNAKNSRFKIIDTSDEEKQKFYARAIIQTQSKNHVTFKREFPEIFGKFFEN